MRPIDADALKKWVEEYNASNWGIPQDELIYAIGSAPTIEPVKHGKWILQDTSYWRATHAGDVQVNRVNLKCPFCGWRNYERKEYNYCPNCGERVERSEE